MDPLVIALFVASIIVAAAAGYTVAELRLGRKQPVREQPVSGDMWEELQDLRHLKKQLEEPPAHHEHLWKRKPDVRKMGWLRFRCEYKDCPAIDWRPA